MDHSQKIQLISLMRTEIKLRQGQWPALIEAQEMDRDTANLRLTALQTAVYMLEQGPTRPKTIQPLEEVLHECKVWQKSIQRNITPATKNADGQKYTLINMFVEYFSPEPKRVEVVQTSLF